MVETVHHEAWGKKGEIMPVDTYMGVPVTEMTKEELIQALKNIARLLREESETHKVELKKLG